MAGTTSDLHQLLPWFLNRTLDAAETETFREHLKECDACRSEVRFVETAQRQLEEHGDALLGGHPSADRLVATVRGELDGPDADGVAGIELCSECALEAEWATEQAIVGAVRSSGSSSSPATAGWKAWSRPGWGWMAAAAALFFVMLMLPSRVEPPTSGAVGLLMIEPPTRSSESATVTPASEQFVLVIPIDFAPSDFPVSVELIDAQGKSIVSQPSVDAETPSNGLAGVPCSRSICVPGDYEIRLSSLPNPEETRLLKFTIAPPTP